MKHFKLILTSMRIIVGVLFVANVIFMMQLYNSIKTRYLNDVEQCLSRGDQIEMVDRIIDAGLVGNDEVVWIQIGLQRSDVGTTMDAEELRKLNYSPRFLRIVRQQQSQFAQYRASYHTEKVRMDLKAQNGGIVEDIKKEFNNSSKEIQENSAKEFQVVIVKQENTTKQVEVEMTNRKSHQNS